MDSETESATDPAQELEGLCGHSHKWWIETKRMFNAHWPDFCRRHGIPEEADFSMAELVAADVNYAMHGRR